MGERQETRDITAALAGNLIPVPRNLEEERGIGIEKGWINPARREER